MPAWNSGATKEDIQRIEQKLDQKGEVGRKTDAEHPDSSQRVGALTDQPSQQVTPNISKLEAELRELAKTQNRRPNLVCTYKGHSLKGQTIALDQEEIRFDVKNSGEVVATNIAFQFYMDLHVPYPGQGPLEILSRSEDPPGDPIPQGRRATRESRPYT